MRTTGPAHAQHLCIGALDSDVAALMLAWLSPRELCRARTLSRQVAAVVDAVADGLRASWERAELAWPSEVRPGSALGLMLLEYFDQCTESLGGGGAARRVVSIARVPLSVRDPQALHMPCVHVLVPLSAWRPDLLGVLPTRQAIHVGLVERRRLVPTPPVALLRVRGLGGGQRAPFGAAASAHHQRAAVGTAQPSQSLVDTRASGADATPMASCHAPSTAPSASTLSGDEQYKLICSFYNQPSSEDDDNRLASTADGPHGSAVPSGPAAAPTLRCGVVQRGAGHSSLYVVTEAQANRACRAALSAGTFGRTWAQLPHGSAECAQHGDALWLVLSWAEAELSENLPLACFADRIRELLRGPHCAAPSSQWSQPLAAELGARSTALPDGLPALQPAHHPTRPSSTS